MKKIFLGTAAGLIWFLAICLAISPIYDYKGILHTLFCVALAFMMTGPGCTVAMAATNKKEDKDVRKAS